MTTYSIRMTRFIYILKLIVHITLVYKNLYNFEDMRDGSYSSGGVSTVDVSLSLNVNSGMMPFAYGGSLFVLRKNIPCDLKKKGSN